MNITITIGGLPVEVRVTHYLPKAAQKWEGES